MGTTKHCSGHNAADSLTKTEAEFGVFCSLNHPPLATMWLLTSDEHIYYFKINCMKMNLIQQQPSLSNNHNIGNSIKLYMVVADGRMPLICNLWIKKKIHWIQFHHCLKIGLNNCELAFLKFLEIFWAIFYHWVVGMVEGRGLVSPSCPMSIPAVLWHKNAKLYKIQKKIFCFRNCFKLKLNGNLAISYELLIFQQYE